MFVQYYSPQFRFTSFARSLFVAKSKDKTIVYYKAHTDKKYVLPTYSCRSALYLAYSVLPSKGEVITSPLTCDSAVKPIFWSGNKVRFVDIDINTLNIDSDLISDSCNDKTIAVQLINHGGIANDTLNVRKKISPKILIIEDCAQSFSATNKQKVAGYYADIACYSMIKNAYGLGGGILATNNKEIYEKAKTLQNTFEKERSVVLFYRILMSWFESHQSYAIIRKIYSFIFSLRKKKADNLSTYNEELKRFMKKSHPYFLRYFASRIKKMENWQKQRFEKGIKLYKALREKELLNNYSSLDIIEHSSFTKFFIYHPKIETDKLMHKLNINGIEVKHLEHKQIPQVQERFDRFENDGSLASCVNYHLVHDSLISLPLHEGISDKEINFIVQNLSQQIYE